MNTRRMLSIPVIALGLSLAIPSFAQTFTYTQIDVPNSSLTRPFGSNSLGQIVGLSRDGDGTPHGFLRDTDGTYLKFEYPGAIFTNATSINDQGQIVGRWIDSRGYNHTYLRSPSGDFSNFDPPAPCFPGLADNRGSPAPAPYKPTIAHGINNRGDRGRPVLRARRPRVRLDPLQRWDLSNPYGHELRLVGCLVRAQRRPIHRGRRLQRRCWSILPQSW